MSNTISEEMGSGRQALHLNTFERGEHRDIRVDHPVQREGSGRHRAVHVERIVQAPSYLRENCIHRFRICFKYLATTSRT